MTDNGKKYKCGKCPDNFEGGNGETCYHDNPCSLGRDDPDGHSCVNSECVHVVGGYKCVCLEGYEKEPEDENSCLGEQFFLFLKKRTNFFFSKTLFIEILIFFI